MKTTFEFESVSDNRKFNTITAYVDATKLPTHFPMGTNPRKQNMKTATARGIVNSLYNDSVFYHVNRGITMSVANVKIKGNQITLSFDDELTNGIIDGGHTYRAIYENKDFIQPGKKIVKLEILIGLSHEEVVKLAAGRNTSQQVVNKSIADMLGYFDWMKEILIENQFPNAVEYRENYGGICIGELIAIWTLFDIEQFPNVIAEPRPKFPTRCLSARKVSINRYIKQYRDSGIDCSTYKLKNIMYDIIRLYDMVEKRFSLYVKGDNIKTSDIKRTVLLNSEAEYRPRKDYVYLVLAPFRQFVKVDEDGFFAWMEDPFTLVEKYMGSLIPIILEETKGQSFQDLRKVTTLRSLWSELYNTLARLYLTDKQN